MIFTFYALLAELGASKLSSTRLHLKAFFGSSMSPRTGSPNRKPRPLSRTFPRGRRGVESAPVGPPDDCCSSGKDICEDGEPKTPLCRTNLPRGMGHAWF